MEQKQTFRWSYCDSITVCSKVCTPAFNWHLGLVQKLQLCSPEAAQGQARRGRAVLGLWEVDGERRASGPWRLRLPEPWLPGQREASRRSICRGAGSQRWGCDWMQLAGTPWHKPRHLSVPLARQHLCSGSLFIGFHMENSSGVPLQQHTEGRSQPWSSVSTLSVLSHSHMYGATLYLYGLNKLEKATTKSMCVCVFIYMSILVFERLHMFTAGGQQGHLYAFSIFSTQDGQTLAVNS